MTSGTRWVVIRGNAQQEGMVRVLSTGTGQRRQVRPSHGGYECAYRWILEDFARVPQLAPI